MATDWIKSIFIIMMFSLFLVVDTYNVGIKSLQNNWNLNRCNPIMMPFAGYIAPKGSNISTQDNFSYCIQNMMTNFAPSMFQPFNYIQSMTVDMMNSINDSLYASTSNSSFFRFSMSSIFGNIYGVFLNSVIEFNILIIKIMDTQGKISGIVTTLLYIMTAVNYTFQSMWNGIPGEMIQTIGNL